MVTNKTLSVCMIVKNEAHQLEELLQKVVFFADEIIVVDTGSEDKTVEIAKQFTAKVYNFRWIDDFSAARNFALEYSSKSYFLWLDADDRIPEESIKQINTLKEYFDGHKFFYFILKDMTNDRVNSLTYQVRCAPLKKDVCFKGAIHEELLTSLSTSGYIPVKTDIVIEHRGYSNPSTFRKKMERNLKILLDEYNRHPEETSLSHLFYLVETHFSLGNLDESERLLKKILKLERVFSPILIEIYLILAAIAIKKGECQEALRWLVKAEVHSSGGRIHLYRLGCLYETIRENWRALKVFEQSLSGTYEVTTIPSMPPPPLWEIFLHISFNAMVCRRYELFQEALEKAQESASLGDAYEWLICHALNHDRLDLAEAFAKVARAKNINNPNILVNMGLMETKKGNNSEAEKYYKKALEVDPSHFKAKLNLACTYLMMSQASRAVKIYRSLISGGCGEWEVILGGLLASLMSRTDTVFFEKALRKKMSFKETASLKELIRLCQTRLLEEQGLHLGNTIQSLLNLL